MTVDYLRSTNLRSVKRRYFLGKGLGAGESIVMVCFSKSTAVLDGEIRKKEGASEQDKEQYDIVASIQFFFTYTQMYPAEQVVTKPSSWEVAMLKLRTQFTKSRPTAERK